MIRRIRSKARRLSTAAIICGAMEVTATRAIAAPPPGTLPIPCSVCVTGVTGAPPITTWVTSGVATYVTSGNSMTINQTTDRAILNWQSFNISTDGKVTFKQPDANSIALNRIFDGNTTQIFGGLQANGQVYLINQNGFLFGATARVNTGGLLTSTLSLDDSVFTNGLLSNTQSGKAALELARNMANITVESGARLTTNEAGQRILLAAKTINNQGEIVANDGQVILAAGEKVYLAASDDPALRGLLVEVDGGATTGANDVIATVTNTGTVTAERGNITAVGLAVNQNGRMTATTSVSANGSIRLLARDAVLPGTDEVTSKVVFNAQRGGALTLGADSVTAVNVDANDKTTAVDEQEQIKSSIELVGKTVQLASGSRVQAAGGNLKVLAASNPSDAQSRSEGIVDAGARIRVDSGAVIDLSGSLATASVKRNLVTAELRGNELADKPLQRDGVLRGQTVVVDARVGTNLADVSGQLALIGKDVLERTSAGGTAIFDSAGDVVVAENSTINVSGGAVNFTGGLMQTTQLIKADGSTIDIGKASPDAIYVGLISPVYKQVFDRWGVVKNISAPGLGKFEAGYTEGADAGKIQFLGKAMVLNGNFIGGVTNGANQRTAADLAKGGRFVIGAPAGTADSFRAPAVEFVARTVPTVIDVNNSLPADTPLYLTTDFISRGGFSQVSIASDAGIKISKATPISLPDGGSLTLAAPRIEIDGSISVASGSISATTLSSLKQPVGVTSGLFIASGTVLDTNGLWVNDSLTPPDRQPVEALLTNGGKISLQQNVVSGVLELGDKVALHASGGAWLKQSGQVVGGKGGSVSLASVNGFDVGKEFSFDGYGVQGASGGSFTLNAPRLSIANGYALGLNSVRNATGVLQVGSDLFSKAGFANFALTATGLPLSTSSNSLTVQAGTNILLAPQTRVLDANASAKPSDRSVGNFAGAIDVLDEQALPTTLSLAALNNVLSSDLEVQDGVRISGNAGSTINLSSIHNLAFNGQLEIAAGSVNMSLQQPDQTSDKGYLDRQLTVGPTARIDVSGALITRPNDAGLRQANVLDGGSVALIANRGSVNVNSGSLIDVSGTQADLDIQVPGGTAYQHRTVASVAGSLTLQAQEGIALQGDFLAYGGIGNGGVRNIGGTLNVSLLPGRASGNQTPYPNIPRGIKVVNGSTAAQNGYAVIGASTMVNSGIESLALTSTAPVLLDAGLNLHLGRSVMLATPQLGVIGTGVANISAAYVTLGSTTVVPGTNAARQLAAASSGSGQLNIQAAQIDLQGLLALSNVNQTTLQSGTDLQLRGYATDAGLWTRGDLTLRAQRVFPTTGSSYAINAPDTTVWIEQAGTSLGVPLSVAGSFKVAAKDIVQGGTLLAPFGRIELNASDKLQLLSGSYTSVSGNGAVLPYGRVDNGSSWVYSATELAAIPDRKIVFNGDAKGANVEMAAGSIVDVSGGGDLLAYQYTPGTGGKQDVLDPTSKGYLKDTYAIVPAVAGQSAPYDPVMWANAALTSGQSIYLADGSGVPAGIYQLLPARYALVPGAYLVSALSGYQDLPAGNTARTTDGATVVAGYYTFGNDQNAAARYSGFAIRPGSYARTLAQYEDRLASAFFAAKADKAGVTAKLPADAGTLSIAVNQSLQALGTVRGRAAAGGDNATVEIATPANTSLEVDALPLGTGSSGTIHIASSQLDDWNVGSLLLGGQRNASGAVNVTTGNVVVHNGAALKADEVVLTASQSIRVESGASVASTSDGQAGAVDASRLADSTALQLTGSNAAKAAVLAVSDLNYLVTDRGVPQTINGANVEIATGAHVGTQGAVAIDASGTVSVASNTIAAQGASWSLGSNHIAFGPASSAADGLAIDSSLQANLQTARAINLNSARQLDVTQNTALGNATTSAILIKAGSIVNVSPGTTANATFTAQKISLQGTVAQANAVTTGQGTLAFNAKEIVLDQGELGVSGFQATNLNASGTVTGQKTGGLVTAGDLQVTGTAITAASGAHTSLKAEQGTVTLSGIGTAPVASSLATGGTLSIKGRDVVDAARIVLPSGVVTLEASNSLSLRDAAEIDAAGFKPALATTGSNGGLVTLNSAGTLTVATGSSINVDAGSQADAGRIDVYSASAADIAGRWSGRADAGHDGGEFGLHVGSLNDFATLNRTLEQGGFTTTRDYRVNTGDLVLGVNDRITARQVALTADAGSVTVNGKVVASSSEQRGSIAVNARNNVVIGATAQLNASAIDATTQRAGSIELATTNGHIQLAATADIQAAGKDQSGTLTLRAPATATDFNLDSVPTSLSKVDTVVLQPLNSYVAAETPTAADFETIRTNLNSYLVGAKTGILNRLGLNGVGNVVLRPYADITRQGDITLADPIDFSLWRFAGQPATVSIRATGNLTIDGSLNIDKSGTLSDGFKQVDTNLGPALELLGTSSAFNLVAGADLSSASMQAYQRGNNSDLSLSNGAIVRAGTGDVRLTAANNIVIGQGSSIYTGGVQAAATVDEVKSGGEIYASFADRGGNVVLTAGSDVVGSVVNQAISDWNVRWAPFKSDGSSSGSSAYWGIDLGNFGWNVGALGGGDVTIAAKGKVTDISAAVADSAANVAGTRRSFGGGNLSIAAGGNIDSGYFYVANGVGDLKTWASFGTSGNRKDIANRSVGTALLAGDAQYQLAAVGDVMFEGEEQASLLDPTRFSIVNDSGVSFARYEAGSSLSVNSSGGSIDFRTGDEGNPHLLPGSVSLNAFGGDLRLLGSMSMFPSSTGGLVAYAARDVVGAGIEIAMSDVAPIIQGSSATNVLADSGLQVAALLKDNTGDVLHKDDAIVSRVTAGRDIDGSNGLVLSLAEATEVQAGRDIRDLLLDTQQAGKATTTSLIAGRDFIYNNPKEIVVGGSGLLEVQAGRDINLGISKGISTTGDLLNGNLPDKTGASVIAIAGLNQPMDISAFITKVVVGNESLQNKLITYVEKQTGQSGFGYATAETQFLTLPVTQQTPFVVDALFGELVASGREANAGANIGFARGYAALSSLFTGSQGATNPYVGDISLPFSRVYTLDGGSISLLAPGGKIDVGLANPPSVSGLIDFLKSRKPSDLGIVAQQAGDVHVLSDGDVLVNSSRIFTLGGGDIAIWSSKGNIDAGKGAKSSISAPPPTLTVDAEGNVSINVGSAVAGSGIRTIVTSEDITPGNVDLIAPVGFVNAGDAGIGSAGNLNIAAQRVVGLDNIQVGGSSTGVPPETGGLGAALSGVTASAGNTTTSAANSIGDTQAADKPPAALADAALSWLEVFVVGLGEENCKQDDLECLKRQSNK